MDKKEFASAFWVSDISTNFEKDGVQGNLTFTGSGLDLTIPIGYLFDYEENNGVKVLTLNPIDAPVAFGFCQTGEKITLMDIWTPGPGFTSPGYYHENLHAESALISKETFISPNPLIKNLRLQISCLWDWFGKAFGQISNEFDSDTGKWNKTNATWKNDELEEIPLFKNNNVDICLQPILTFKGGPLPQQEFSVKSDVYLQLSFHNSAIRLDEAMNQWVYPMWQFLTFCMGFRSSIEEVKIRTEDNHDAYYFLPLINGEKNPSKTKLDSMPLPYDFVSQSHSDLLGNWLNMTGDTQRAARVLTGVQSNNENTQLDSIFTTVSSALEAISRVGEKSRDIERTRFKKIQNNIDICLDSEKDIQWIKNKLNNIPSANYYTEALLKKLKVFGNYIVPDQTRFLKDLRNNRNAYVHQTSALDENNTFANKELYVLTLAVKSLCYGALMMQLGMTDDEILKCFKTTRFCHVEINLIREMYALKQN